MNDEEYLSYYEKVSPADTYIDLLSKIYNKCYYKIDLSKYSLKMKRYICLKKPNNVQYFNIS